MKKIFAFLLVSLAVVSCYKDYLQDFDYSSVYFTYPIDVRSVVVGEGMRIQLGVVLGGVSTNTRDRNVSFSIDNTLVNSTALTAMKSAAAYIQSAVNSVTALSPLPANYYTLSDNSKMVIKTGQNMGLITLKVDSAAFLTDPATLSPNYAIALNITSADADTILQVKRTAVIGLKYENMLFGNYLHGGVTTIKDAAGNVVQTIPYYTAVNAPETAIWKLTTVAPNALITNGYSNKTTAKGEMKLTLDGSNITVSSNTGATNAILPDGASSFNTAKLLQNRKILLNYKYVVGTNTYYCQDTLTFRNRIRDGVNEWQDENPSHYVK